MILHARMAHAQATGPWLVFLHGFSGDSLEWQPVGDRICGCPCLYIDLPGHGGSAGITVGSFAEMRYLLSATLNSYNILKYWLVGYSLGGRIAMDFACEAPAGICGLVVEGGHPGLTDEAERSSRRASDRRWAERLRHEPLSEVFTDWYQQPVFASLQAQQRAQLIALRSQNSGRALAAMLEATSLAVQADLRAALRQCAFPVHYLCGERDSKFRALSAEIAARSHLINAAGHNAHRENPEAVAACLAQILRLI
ncbi:2-succinyl-6-hydroxy-2,4-cyclohexadiene-1-carboxylate synthase [Yokenella regensburgei]|uniref:2-succinyl-6-hydroxy-2, 4-cyclohexadiene-1-carboxylate synthase n=1 Tax=Yokenella regensburgei TaxID=158877 RepID=UPI003F168551